MYITLYAMTGSIHISLQNIFYNDYAMFLQILSMYIMEYIKTYFAFMQTEVAYGDRRKIGMRQKYHRLSHSDAEQRLFGQHPF